MKRLGFIFAAACNVGLIFVGCRCTPVVEPVPVVDAGEVESAARATCATACTHARALGCAFAKGTDAGATCEAVCGNVVKQGVLEWNLSCRSTAKTCALVEACERP